MGIAMTDNPRPRGRPKGTGIDDREILQSIFSLLNEDVGLRPTTAIRQLGISDPSVVRRLREKLKTDGHTATPATPGASTGTGTGSAAKQEPAVRQPQPRMPARKKQSSEKREQDTIASKYPEPQEAPQPASPAQQAPQSPQPEAPVSSIAQPSPNVEPPAMPPGVGAPKLPLADPQLEALRLASEAAGAMSRLYLHCMSFAQQTNPLALALRSQTVMSDFFSSILSAAPPR